MLILKTQVDLLIISKCLLDLQKKFIVVEAKKNVSDVFPLAVKIEKIIFKLKNYIIKFKSPVTVYCCKK